MKNDKPPENICIWLYEKVLLEILNSIFIVLHKYIKNMREHNLKEKRQDWMSK